MTKIPRNKLASAMPLLKATYIQEDKEATLKKAADVEHPEILYVLLRQSRLIFRLMKSHQFIKSSSRTLYIFMAFLIALVTSLA